nr:pentapeptide repeat-containing protein [Streptomyces sp. HNM0574]
MLFTGISSYQAQNQLQITQERQELDRQAQTADRFTTAISQLGDKSVDVRLGGIYALQDIMKDSPGDQPAIVNVLSAYIRTHSKAPKSQPSPESKDALTEEDVTAAAATLGARKPEHDGQAKVNLAGTRLRDADLRGVDLRGANVEGADLREAEYEGVQGDLDGARKD